MRSTTECCVNALSYFFGLLILMGTSALAENFNSTKKIEIKFSDSSRDSNSIHLAGGRRMSFLELPPGDVNFKFADSKYFWIATEDDFKKFWNENSRTSPETPPTLNLNWKEESLLAIFWPSVDTVIRYPDYMYAEELTSQTGTKDLRLSFLIHQPCFGIITDASPVKFLVAGRNMSDIDSVSISTSNAKVLGCY